MISIIKRAYKKSATTRCNRHWFIPMLIGIVVLSAGIVMAEEADDLEGLLEQVGKDYGTGYVSPFIYAFGPNQNSGLFQTANISWGKLSFGFGLKFMASNLSEDDQTFRVTREDVAFSNYLSPGDAHYNNTGDIVMSGPTIFGDTENEGTISGYVNGLEVFRMNTIAGLFESRYVPFATPEAYVGGMYGLKFTLRYLPELDISDYGKTKFMGYGLQWSANGLLPTMPVDVMVGFFKQEMDVGTILETNATSIFVAASKSYGPTTVYAGLAKESSDMTVSYTYLEGNGGAGRAITFETDGIQDYRFTVGASFNLGAKLNVEMARGEITTYTAGLMFGM